MSNDFNFLKHTQADVKSVQNQRHNGAASSGKVGVGVPRVGQASGQQPAQWRWFSWARLTGREPFLHRQHVCAQRIFGLAAGAMLDQAAAILPNYLVAGRRRQRRKPDIRQLALILSLGGGGEPGLRSRIAARANDEGDGFMLTRTAIYEGVLEPGTDEDGFFVAVREKLEPIWRSFPEVLDVRVHRVKDADPGAIPIVMILEMDFADRASLDRSLASDIKQRSHALTLEVLKPFLGRFFHLVAEAHSVAA